MAETPQCSSCRYFRANLSFPEAEPGACRRYPPVSVFDQRAAEMKSLFPMVHARNLCGEYVLAEHLKD